MNHGKISIWIGALFLAILIPWIQPYAYLPVPQLNSNALSMALWSIFLLFSWREFASYSFFNFKINQSQEYNFILLAGLLVLGILFFDLASGKLGFASAFVPGATATVLAILVAAHGYHVAKADHSEVLFNWLIYSLTTAALISSLFGWLQFFDIQFAPWISLLPEPGRVFANVRQPNQLATLLALGIWSACWLRDRRKISPLAATSIILFLTPCLVFTGSRMAIILLGYILLLGVYFQKFDLRAFLEKYAYIVLIYAVTWYLAEAARLQGLIFFHGGERVADADPTGLRWQLWINSIEISLLNPILGCGFNQFNFCFIHAPLESRAPAPFDHAHNIILQWAVEFGWPVAILLTLAFGAWATKLFKDAANPQTGYAIGFLGVVAIHSMLEHPLWYAAFLMPTAFLVGYCTQRNQANHTDTNTIAQKRLISVLLPKVVLFFIVLGSIYSIYIHSRLAKNYTAGSELTAAERHKNTEVAWIFRPQITYAQAMYVSNGAPLSEMPQILSFFKLASHAHMDEKFLIRYAQIAALSGENDLAHHLAWRSIQLNPKSAEEYNYAADTSDIESLRNLAEFASSKTPFNLPPSRLKDILRP